MHQHDHVERVDEDIFVALVAEAAQRFQRQALGLFLGEFPGLGAVVIVLRDADRPLHHALQFGALEVLQIGAKRIELKRQHPGKADGENGDQGIEAAGNAAGEQG